MISSARIEDLQRKYEENPGRYFASLADELRRSGDARRAAALCETHLRTIPGHLSGHVVLGQALADLGDPAEAERAFSRAIELDPENLIALRSLGDLARQGADRERAREWYQRALEVDPRDPELATRMATLDESPAEQPAVTPDSVQPAAGGDSYDAEPMTVAADPPEQPASEQALSDMDRELAEQEDASEFTAGFFAEVLREGLEDTTEKVAPLTHSLDMRTVSEMPPRSDSTPTPRAHPRVDEGEPPVVQVAEEPTDTLPDESDLLRQIAMLEADLEREVNDLRREAAGEHDDQVASELDEPPTGGEGSTLPDEETDHFFDDLPAIAVESVGSLDPDPMNGTVRGVNESDHAIPAISASAEDEPQQGSAAPFITATMASLLVQQGFHADALEVYRQLSTLNPADESLALKVRELEERLAGRGAAADEPSTGGWLRDLAAARPEMTARAADARAMPVAEVATAPAEGADGPAGWVDAEQDEESAAAADVRVDGSAPAEATLNDAASLLHPISDPLGWDDLWGDEDSAVSGPADESVSSAIPDVPEARLSLEEMTARPVGQEDEAAAGALVAATLAMQGDPELDDRLAETIAADPGSLANLLNQPSAIGTAPARDRVSFSFDQFFQPAEQESLVTKDGGSSAIPSSMEPAADDAEAARAADLAEFNDWLSRLSES